MTKREVNAEEAVKDILAGMDDFSLMQKYRITAKGLQSLFTKLVKAGLLTKSEIDHPRSLYDETVEVIRICPECGKIRPVGSVQCPNCGAEVSKF